MRILLKQIRTLNQIPAIPSKLFLPKKQVGFRIITQTVFQSQSVEIFLMMKIINGSRMIGLLQISNA